MTVNKHAEEFKAKAAEEKIEKAKAIRKAKSRTLKPKKPKSISSVAKARKLTFVLSETPTFGAIIPASKVTVQGGFVYKLTITHPKMPSFKKYYIGKKSWASKKAWTHYQSSSDKVMALLNHGCIISYEVIEYCITDTGLNRSESTLIAKSWATDALRDVSVNFGIVLSGKKMSRMVYCRNILKQVDKRF